MVGGVLVVGALAGCDRNDDATGATPSESSASTTEPAIVERATTSDSDTAPTTTVDATTTVVTPPTASETIATVPEEGVPGIDSADPFCRAWSEFAGTFQALAFASALDVADAAEREVVAAAAVVDAVRTLDDEFPESIVAERVVFVGDVIGPFARRSERAVDELRLAGLDDEQIIALGDVWLRALADAGVDDPEFTVAVPDDLVAAVDAATAAFADDVPPIAADPSLITDADTPATLAYLAERCPDQGILAGNDAIG